MRLYGELVPWYRMIDPPEDHRAEADVFRAALEGAASGTVETLLELGAGAGHNAVHLKERFRCTLADLSPDMSALSRALNPECEHVLGDMRSLRLGRTFDAVLVHDAVAYMTTEDDLRKAAQTAFVHTRPGGAAIFTPDGTIEDFLESCETLEGDDGERALRGVFWCWDPDPTDTTCLGEFGLLLREGGTVRSVHERHVFGLFPRETWVRVLTETGYVVDPLARPVGGGEFDEVFLCRRAASPHEEGER